MEEKKTVGRKSTIKKTESNVVKFLVDVIQKVEGGVWKSGKEYEIADNKRIELIIKNRWGILVGKKEEFIKEANKEE